MRAEAGLGGVPAAAMAIAEQRVQPAVAGTALGEIVDQLDMAVTLAERRRDVVERQRRRMVARQPAERVTGDLVALGIIDQRGDRQFTLRKRHRRRQ